MATQKKRRLDEDAAAAELSRLNDDSVGPDLPPHLKEGATDPQARRIAELEGALKHLRNWMKATQDQMQGNPMHRDTVFNARRLFVGHVPTGTTDEELCKFLGNAIISTGAAISSLGRPVTYCRIQRDKNFAFVEVRSAEEASNAMALDGLVFKDNPLKIKRPSKYDATAAITLGPTEPNPSMDLSCVVINKPPPAAAAGSAGDRDLPQGKYEATPNTLYIGGLPIEWTNEQCMELLKMYGEVKYFRLMMDRQTGNSRGFAFAEYTTDEATSAALAALDGAQLGPRRIAANRMLQHKQKQQQHQVQQQGTWGGQQMGAPGCGSLGGWGSRQEQYGASGGMGRGPMGGGMGPGGGRMGGMGGMAGGMGVQQGPGAGIDGPMGPQGGMMPQTPAPVAGMQQVSAGGYGVDGMGGGYGMALQQHQQGMYGAGAGGGMGVINSGMVGQGGIAAAAGGMQGISANQQGLYGMNQPAAAGGYDAYGGQIQQGVGGMYGGQMPGGQQLQQQQQPMGKLMGAGPAAGVGADMQGGSMGMAGGMAGMAGGYGQPHDQQQQQQQPGFGAAAGMGSGQVAGMQGAVGIGGIQQPQPPHRPDYAAVAVKTEPGGGPASTGMAGVGIGGWQGQQQGFMPAGSQQMQNWG